MGWWKNTKKEDYRLRVKLEIYKNRRKRWMWRFRGQNDCIVADSVNDFRVRNDCIVAAKLIINGIVVVEESIESI